MHRLTRRSLLGIGAAGGMELVYKDLVCRQKSMVFGNQRLRTRPQDGRGPWVNWLYVQTCREPLWMAQCPLSFGQKGIRRLTARREAAPRMRVSSFRHRGNFSCPSNQRKYTASLNGVNCEGKDVLPQQLPRQNYSAYGINGLRRQA